jgi:histidyl-tRNA synthetase
VLKLPRGTRDFSPDEMNKRNYVENSMRATFEKYGYKEIETPVMEYLELFTKKSGETIIDEIYTFKDKGGRELSLRPELTAPVIRFYIDKLQMKPKPLKLFYFGKCYRYDRPQKGRYREFKQAGCEIIGTNKPEAFAELISMSYNILRNIGVKDIILNIGNLKILSYFFDELKVSKDQRKYIMSLIDKSKIEELTEALIIFGFDEIKVDKFLNILKTDDINNILNYINEKKEIIDEINNLKEIFKFLNSSFKIKFNLKLGIVRGLDYYSGLVFEIEAPSLGAEKQICGGGQYELINNFGGKETPTAGFAIGFDRTIIALEMEKYNYPEKKLDFYIIPVNDNMIEKSLEIIELIRNKNVNVDIDLLRRGVSKSLKYASSINVLNSIIIGPKELNSNSVTIRNMETGHQKIIKLDQLIKSI